MAAEFVSAWASCPLPCPSAKTRLFCLPYAGSGASIYRDWPEALAPEIEVWPVHLPGRERRLSESPLASIQKLAEHAASGMAPLLGRRYALFGHSMGALISFEITRALRRAGHSLPQALLVSGYGGPHCGDRRAPIHGLPDDEFKGEIQVLNGTPADVIANAELMDLLLPLLRADFQAVETYDFTEEAPFDLPIHVYCGRDDHETPIEQLAQWDCHTTVGSRVTLFEGDHFYLRQSGAALRAQLCKDLQQVIGQ
ncbi:MAG: thioesterase [Gammaproteobacteria bacterium]|nr:thioesterase [Gammaproteobacteria bacterium]